MASQGLKFVFATSLPAMTVRGDYIGLADKKRDFCRAFAIGFGLSESQGDDIYTNGVSENDFSVINGFNAGSVHEIHEGYVQDVLEGYYATSSLSDNQRQILAAAVNSILFGYAATNAIKVSELYTPIGQTLVEVGERVLGIQPLTIISAEEGIPSYVIHPFTETVIKSLLTLSNY